MKHSVTCTALALVLFAAAACDQDPKVSQYTQKKEATEATMPSATASSTGAPAEAAGVTWKLPDGWKDDPTPHQMREATFIVGDGSAEVIVSRLGAQFGDLTSNVNRWRAQIGLAPVEDASSLNIRKAQTPAGEAQVIKLEGDQKSTIVAIVKQNDSSWFFRLTGAKSTVADNEKKMDEFLQTLKL